MCVRAGNIPEDRFVAFFVESFKEEEPSEFDTTMEQFMVCAKECRDAKVSVKSRRLACFKAAEAEVARLAAEKSELQHTIDVQSAELETQVGHY